MEELVHNDDGDGRVVESRVKRGLGITGGSICDINEALRVELHRTISSEAGTFIVHLSLSGRRCQLC